MKCTYCGNNLGIEDEICPHCGKINEQAAKHVADMKNYKEDYDQTKDEVIKKSTKFNTRTARLAIIAVMVIIVAVILIITKSYADIDTRIERNQQKVAEDREKNKENIQATLKEMEEHRDYLAMNYFVLNHELSMDTEYMDYTRVFTAATTYTEIHSAILSLVSDYTYFDEKTKKDWCNDIASYITSWSVYVDGGFWGDTSDSPMHSAEHQGFIDDAKKEAQDMVQVYFELTDEQAVAMWDMSSEELGNVLYEKCIDLYPEENANE